MLKSLFFLSRFYIFWLLFFFLDRLVFLLYFTEKLKGVSFLEILQTFVNGIRLDMSMAGYISAIPLLVFLICRLFKIKISTKIPRWYTRIIIIFFSFISIVNFNIYREWGTKINYRALDFALNTPQEAIASSSSSPVFSSFLIFFILIAISFWLEKKVINYKIPAENITWYSLTALPLISVFLTFTLIRGGWQLSPINESMSYFSDKPFLNHAAVNTEWTMVHDILDNKFGNKNPYKYYESREEAYNVLKDLYRKPTAESPPVLTTTRPNVVVIILESFTADVIESNGGEKGITPRIEGLINKGIFFSNIYATGDRTDKGLIGVLSGFPSQAIRSILKINNKHEKLPSLAQAFKKENYNTSFYYGGESEFFNLKSYILSHSYQRLIDKHDFSSKDMNSKWGAYDGVVFEKQLNDLKNSPTPFFSTLLTLTNHEPFELPGTPRFNSGTDGDKFRSTAFYTDSCLGNYLDEARKQPWYKNTLFVIVADHGHRLPKNEYENYNPNRFRIPLLFYGHDIRAQFEGKKIEMLGSQTDIAATLLNQLKLDSTPFKWSKDLLNPGVKPFAFFNWDNGFGFATPKQTISFDNVSKQVIYRKNRVPDSIDNKSVKLGKAMMQTVFQEYMDY